MNLELAKEKGFLEAVLRAVAEVKCISQDLVDLNGTRLGQIEQVIIKSKIRDEVGLGFSDCKIARTVGDVIEHLDYG